MAAESLSQLPRDLLVEVLARVDGPSVASAACACADLHGAANEESLWEELCHGAWPSTTEGTARKLVSSMPGGFAKLYADALPLLLYKPSRRRGSVLVDSVTTPPMSLEYLVSFVDVYYKKKCVISRVVLGTPLKDPSDGFPSCPFKLDALGTMAAGGDETGAAPSILVEPKEEGGVGLLSWALEEDLTLSWVLLDAARGRAVNIAGGKPTAVERDWPSKGDLVVRFGCAVPVEQQLLACGAAECVVSLRCQLSEEEEDRMSCTSVELQVADAEGVFVDWRRGVAVLERALCCKTRTSNEAAAAAGYRDFVKDRRERRGKGRESGVLGNLCALCGSVLFVGIWLLLL